MKLNRSLYVLFLGCLTKKGSKVRAKKILDRALLNASSKFGVSTNGLFTKVLNRMGTPVEIKALTKGKNKVIVPFPVKNKRRNYLLVKNIVDSVKGVADPILLEKKAFHKKKEVKIKDRRSLSEKLSEEFCNIILNKSCQSINRHKKKLERALSNRSNTHFRW